MQEDTVVVVLAALQRGHLIAGVVLGEGDGAAGGQVAADEKWADVGGAISLCATRETHYMLAGGIEQVERGVHDGEVAAVGRRQLVVGIEPARKKLLPTDGLHRQHLARREPHRHVTRPADAAGYEAFYGCPVRFGSLRNALHTQPAWCAFALPWANGAATRLSTQLLRREVERLDAGPAIGFSVARSIRRRLPDVALLGQLAASLNLSERTLRRQLAQAGLSYRQLLDEGRKARAFELMAAGQRSLGEIAAAAGFSDARAFTRAFRRWTGHAPTGERGLAASAVHPWVPGLD